MDERQTNTHDENGRVFRATLLYPVDEMATTTIVHLGTYDANGNLLTQEWDTDGDGMLDVRSAYTYDCWE